MNALLYVLCGEKHESASMIPWNKDQDKVLVNEDDLITMLIAKEYGPVMKDPTGLGNR